MAGALLVGINSTERSMKFRLYSLTNQKCSSGPLFVQLLIQWCFNYFFLNRGTCYFFRGGFLISGDVFSKAYLEAGAAQRRVMKVRKGLENTSYEEQLRVFSLY